jgi:hypothetical protein
VYFLPLLTPPGRPFMGRPLVLFQTEPRLGLQTQFDEMTDDEQINL